MVTDEWPPETQTSTASASTAPTSLPSQVHQQSASATHKKTALGTTEHKMEHDSSTMSATSHAIQTASSSLNAPLGEHPSKSPSKAEPLDHVAPTNPSQTTTLHYSNNIQNSNSNSNSNPNPNPNHAVSTNVVNANATTKGINATTSGQSFNTAAITPSADSATPAQLPTSVWLDSPETLMLKEPSKLTILRKPRKPVHWDNTDVITENWLRLGNPSLHCHFSSLSAEILNPP
ncbi:hypothetical protein SeMB42_g03542, partial [Synchytrium endobioticum]